MSGATAADGSSRDYLVMEYLEGETLADRLARGALPLSQVIGHGAAIARALDAAHREQIVHRDLKPGNIMLTQAGIKLLDFGLAKAADPVAAPRADLTTQVVPAVTTPGAVMGTVPYMAPEQLEGRPADRRSDIFALGAVLYEMATGRRPFDGSSAAAVTSAILTTDPPAIIPSAGVDRIVRTCLEKDPERRWQSAYDVALQLEALDRRDDERTAPGRRAASALGHRRGGDPHRAGGAHLGRTAIVHCRRRRPSSKVAFALPPPARGSFVQSVEWVASAVAPDGSAVAYSARAADGRSRLWLRRIQSAAAEPLEGTDGATSVFWSPDARSLAFFAAGKLKRVELGTRGTPITICDVPEVIGLMGTWGQGRILFASVQGEALWSVPASGGAATEVRKPNKDHGERRLTWPVFLPDGRAYLYLSTFPDDSGDVMLATGDGEPRKVMDVKSNVQYVEPGYLVYVADGSLVARRFDPIAGTVSGDPIQVGDRVLYFKATGLGHFSTSRNGVVAYHPDEDESRVALFERSGREAARIRPVANYQQLSLAPDARRLLFDRIDPRTGTLDVWVLDLQRGVETRVTNEPRTDTFALWGPRDSVIFSVASGSAPRLFRRDLATGKDEELSPPGSGLQRPTSVSPDGEFVLYGQRTPRGNFDIMLRRLADNQTLPFRQSAADESDGQFSPDGRLVAYVTDETGRPEVVVAPFKSGIANTPVSIDSGHSPRWSADGRELFFIASDGELMAVPVRMAPSLEVGPPVRLFTTRGPDGPWGAYQVTPNGQFLAVVRTQIASQQPMTVVMNWLGSNSR